MVRIKQRPQKYFGKFREPLVKLPSLVESQIKSFTDFVEGGAERVFKEFSPIADHSGKKFELELVKFTFGDLRWDEQYAKRAMKTYEAPLSMVVRLKNKTTGDKKEQEIFLADFPWMTAHGTFIINGVERIVVPQLARSYGVFFESVPYKGKNYFAAKIIPARGVWIEIESDPDGGIYVKVDRKRRFPVTSLLRVLGLSTEKEILDKIRNITDAKLEFLSRGAPLDTPEENPWVQRFLACSAEVLGKPAEIQGGHGASDVRHFADAGIPGFLCAVPGSGAHGPEEYADITRIVPFYSILERFVSHVRKI